MSRILLLAALSIGCVTFRSSPPVTTVGNNNTVHVTVNEPATVVEKKVYVDSPNYAKTYSRYETPYAFDPKKAANIVAGIIGAVGVGAGIYTWNVADTKEAEYDQMLYDTPDSYSRFNSCAKAGIKQESSPVCRQIQDLKDKQHNVKVGSVWAMIVGSLTLVFSF